MATEPLPEPDHDDEPRRWSIRWWFARLVFSFLIVGFVVGYEGYQAQQRGESARATIMMIGAAAGITLGFVGLRGAPSALTGNVTILPRRDISVVSIPRRGTHRREELPAMQAPVQETTRKQAVVTGRVISYYHRLLNRIIGRSKRPTTARSDIECMRMCVEAADGKRNAA